MDDMIRRLPLSNNVQYTPRVHVAVPLSSLLNVSNTVQCSPGNT